VFKWEPQTPLEEAARPVPGPGRKTGTKGLKYIIELLKTVQK
jgi:hypothetical protein